MEQHDNHVVVTDIRMPFMSMVTFMVKWAIAAIPAIIILAVIGSVLVGFFGGILGGIGNVGSNYQSSPATAPSRIAPASVLYQGYLSAKAAGSQATVDDYAAKIRQNYPDSPERRLLDSTQ
jgi:hypothetical protein